MAQAQIEFYEDNGVKTHVEETAYGRLISSVDASSMTTSVSHAAIPGGCTLIRVVTDTAMFVEIGTGNQDCGATRRSQVNDQFDTLRCSADTVITYRSVA